MVWYDLLRLQRDKWDNISANIETQWNMNFIAISGSPCLRLQEPRAASRGESGPWCLSCFVVSMPYGCSITWVQNVSSHLQNSMVTFVSTHYSGWLEKMIAKSCQQIRHIQNYKHIQRSLLSQWTLQKKFSHWPSHLVHRQNSCSSAGCSETAYFTSTAQTAGQWGAVGWRPESET